MSDDQLGTCESTFGRNSGLHEKNKSCVNWKPSVSSPEPAPTYPKLCDLCDKQIESQTDLDWHGLGNCVPICEHCDGSGIEPAPTSEHAADVEHAERYRRVAAQPAGERLEQLVRIQVIPAGGHARFRSEGDTYRVLVGHMDALTTGSEKAAQDCADEYKRILAAFAAAERKRQMEEDCKAVCWLCSDGIPLIDDGVHDKLDICGERIDCLGAAIRKLAEEGAVR